MNTFKKKSLHVAVLAGLGALAAAGTANAVHINPDGLGQVLIFPHYTVRAGHFTAISVINSTSQTKAVKVRFIEGRDSREVLDFNLWMSPTDVWTGAVVASANGAKLISNDNSCVTPSDLFTEVRTDAGSTIVLPGQPILQGAGLTLNEFKNYQYISNGYEARGTELDRTREGYFEVIEMGVVTNTTVTGYVKHSAAGVPANCAALDPLDPSVTPTTPLPTYITAPSGGLAGRASIINGATGANYTFDPTVLDQWSTLVQYTGAGRTDPDLGAVFPLTSNVFTNGGVASATWAAGRDAVSAPMIRDTILNEYILDAGTKSSTDWVVAMPTRRLYVTPTTFAQPFTTTYAGCEPYTVAIYNREEGALGGGGGIVLPSPRPPTTQVGSLLCWESTIVPFQASSLLGSINVSPLVGGVRAYAAGATSQPGALSSPNLKGLQGPNGWMLMSFNSTPGFLQRTVVPTTFSVNGAAPVANTGVHVGLPVIGAMVNNYVTGVNSQYASVIAHKYTRNILTTVAP
jgi:hypothetical protein